MIRELLARNPAEFSSDQTMFDRLVRAQHYGLPTRLLDVTRNPLVALYFASDGSFHQDGSVIAVIMDPNGKKFYDSDTVSCLSNLALLKEDERHEMLNLPSTKARAAKESSTGIFAALDSNEFIEEFCQAAPVDRLLQFIKAEKPFFRPRIRPRDLLFAVSVMPRFTHARIAAQDGAFLLYGLANRQDQMKQVMRNFETESITIPLSSKPEFRSELYDIGISKDRLFPEIENMALQIKDRHS